MTGRIYGSSLVEVCPQCSANSGQTRPKLVESKPTLAECGPTSVEIGRLRTGKGRNWSDRAQTRFKFGHIDFASNLAEFFRNWSKFGPHSTHLDNFQTKFGLLKLGRGKLPRGVRYKDFVLPARFSVPRPQNMQAAQSILCGVQAPATLTSRIPACKGF